MNKPSKLLITINLLLLFGCGGTSWVIRRDENGGIIGYKNYSSSEDANKAIIKLIPCKNFKFVSDQLQSIKSTEVMPIQTKETTYGSAHNNWGTRVNYQETSNGTQYVPMTVDRSYREFTYRCEDQNNFSKTNSSPNDQILFQNTNTRLPPKLGTVNMQKAIQTSEFGKSAKQQLDLVFNAEKAKLKSEEDSLKQMQGDFIGHKSSYSDEEKKEMQMKLQDKFLKYQANISSKQEMIQKLEQDLSTPIIQDIKSVIKDLASKKDYTLILDSNEGSVDDLTEAVIAQYNKQSKQKKSLLKNK